MHPHALPPAQKIRPCHTCVIDSVGTFSKQAVRASSTEKSGASPHAAERAYASVQAWQPSTVAVKMLWSMHEAPSALPC